MFPFFVCVGWGLAGGWLAGFYSRIVDSPGHIFSDVKFRQLLIFSSLLFLLRVSACVNPQYNGRGKRRAIVLTRQTTHKKVGGRGNVMQRQSRQKKEKIKGKSFTTAPIRRQTRQNPPGHKRHRILWEDPPPHHHHPTQLETRSAL